jgi:hypothetical protein
MTNNKDLNLVGELKTQLNTPKTETRIILNDWQEAKTSKLSAAARSKVINRSGSNYLSSWADTDVGEAVGYGPCKICDKATTTVEFKLACPAKDCSSRKESYWQHNNSKCIENKNRMLISNKGWLSCGGCGTGYNMANWKFACSEHEGKYREMSQDSWEMSMSLALATGKTNQTTKDLNVYVTNHPKEFGFKDNE